MRRHLILLLLLGAFVPSLAQAPACTGLCLQQVSCPTGQTTSISGTIYAPNGVDPLPNVTVFIPNAPVVPFKPGVECQAPGAAPSGSPLVGTSTAADGTFKLVNVPVGTNIPLVIQSGRWRRQFTVATTAACTDTAFSGRMPKNQAEGDIPLIAIPTGNSDSVECVLRKVGIDDAEFTNPFASGRIHLYAGTRSRGAIIDANTPSQSALMNDPTELAKYDVLMLPCQGSSAGQADATNLPNLLQYVNGGGRVYASHYSYIWFNSNGNLASVAAWPTNSPGAAGLDTATINTGFSGGKILSDWMQYIGATTTAGQVQVSSVVEDIRTVNPPTQAWLNFNTNSSVAQFTFNTPVSSNNQCGRVLFNQYHVESPTPGGGGRSFPVECNAGPMTNQEKLLEYSLFDLTNTGGQPTLTPTSADFGDQAIGFRSAAKSFTWTNNSIFAAVVSSVTATGDFLVTGNTCGNVQPGASCQISAAFQPTALGKASGTLKVTSNSATTTADLTGNGVPALSISTTALTFPSTDVGATSTQTISVTNVAPGPVALAGAIITGDFAATNTCGSTIPVGGSCAVSVAFTPVATGQRTGSLSAFGSTVVLAGNGVDFSVGINPGSGSVIAGTGITTPFSVLPLAGFSSVVTITCTTNAPASVCTPSRTSFVPSDSAAATVSISTTSRYTVIGYGGFGTGILLIVGLGSSLALVSAGKRRRGVRLAGAIVVLVAASEGLQGCSGKLPDQNVAYTAPGAYTYTVTATDGFLKHSATYSLNVTIK